MIQKPSAQSKEVLWDIRVRSAKTLGDLIEPSALTDAGYAKEWKDPDQRIGLLSLQVRNKRSELETHRYNKALAAWHFRTNKLKQAQEREIIKNMPMSIRKQI